MWMKHRYLHRLYANTLFRKTAMNIAAGLELSLLAGHKDPAILSRIRQARRTRESLLGGNEAFIVYALAKGQRSLPGEMAEVGVYQGCSARLISEASEGKPLHLFDTFDGLPEPAEQEKSHLRENQYRSSLEGVRTYLAHRPAIHFHQGEFPGTAAGLENTVFSFVHIDVDLKSSTRACLDFFYPRLTPGGIIMTHDYSYLDGVREAFDEFIASQAENPARLIELPTSQAFLIR